MGSIIVGSVVVGSVSVGACSNGASNGVAAGTEGGAASQTYSGYVVDPPNEVGGLELPMADPDGSDGPGAPDGAPGATAGFSAEPTGLELVYFGYTFCPDVCPTTMSDVRRVLAALPAEEAERVGVTMVTIDPQRDTAEVLADYVANFVAGGTALRTDDDAALRAVADAFGADYEVRTDDEGDVEVSHTAELYAVDDSGIVVMQWPFGTSHESITRDIRSLLAEADPPA